MALYSWGGGGKDEEWFIIGIIFSSEISETYFVGVEAFFGSPSVWESFESYLARVLSVMREKHVD